MGFPISLLFFVSRPASREFCITEEGLVNTAILTVLQHSTGPNYNTYNHPSIQVKGGRWTRRTWGRCCSSFSAPHRHGALLFSSSLSAVTLYFCHLEMSRHSKRPGLAQPLACQEMCGELQVSAAMDHMQKLLLLLAVTQHCLSSLQ